MALGPAALADQQQSPLPGSFRSIGLTQLERFCTAVSGLHDYQHRRVHIYPQCCRYSGSASGTSQPCAWEGEQHAARRCCIDQEQGSGSGDNGSIRSGQGTDSGGKTSRLVEREQRDSRGSSSSSSSRGITSSAMLGKRRRGATAMLASIPHAYEMAEVRHVLAGTAARTMAQAFIHPIDTIKTRLQVRTPEGLLKTWRKSTRQYPFDFQVGGRRILKTRNVLIAGPGDVYLGLTGAVLGTIPTAAIYFTVYEWSKRQLDRRGWSSAATHVGSASAGAVVSAMVRVPTDTLKHQVQAYLHLNVFQAAHTICRTSGLLGLYRGFWPTLARDVPEIAIQFTLYERLRKSVEQRQGKQRLRTWQHLLLGGISGGVAASVTMPLDYVKTATQCGSPLGVRELVRLTLREKGLQGLFAGMTPRVTQTAIMSAMFFTLFEIWKAALKRDRAPEDRRLNTKMWRKRRDHVWKRQFVLE